MGMVLALVVCMTEVEGLELVGVPKILALKSLPRMYKMWFLHILRAKHQQQPNQKHFLFVHLLQIV